MLSLPSKSKFEGDSIESALSAAVGRLGADMKVVEACKVRTGGMLGFFAKERYEVVAEPQLVLPPSASPPGADAIEETLKALVQEVETREDTASAAIDLRVEESAAVEPPAVEVAKPSLFDFDAWPEVVADAELEPAPEAKPMPAAAGSPAVDFDDAPQWSRDALRQLGLPRDVLVRLPAEDPDTDLAWTAALERAIAAVDPRAGSPLGDGVRLVVNGDGIESALELVFAAAEGYTPGVMRVDGRDVAATSTNLALAVRSCLPR